MYDWQSPSAGSDRTAERTAFGFEMANIDPFRHTPGLLAAGGGGQGDG